MYIYIYMYYSCMFDCLTFLYDPEQPGLVFFCSLFLGNLTFLFYGECPNRENDAIRIEVSSK